MSSWFFVWNQSPFCFSFTFSIFLNVYRVSPDATDTSRWCDYSLCSLFIWKNRRSVIWVLLKVVLCSYKIKSITTIASKIWTHAVGQYSYRIIHYHSKPLSQTNKKVDNKQECGNYTIIHNGILPLTCYKMFRTNIMISFFERPSLVQNFSIFINLSLTNCLQSMPTPLLFRRQNIKIQVWLGFHIVRTVFHTTTTWDFHYYYVWAYMYCLGKCRLFFLIS